MTATAATSRCYVCREPISAGLRFEFIAPATFKLTKYPSAAKQVCRFCMALGMAAIDER